MLLLATAVCTATGSVSAQGGRQNSRYLQSGGRDHARTPRYGRIYKTGDTYEARIIWLEHPNDEAGNPGSTCSIPTRHCGAGRRHCTRARFALRCEKGAVDGRFGYTTPSMAKCTTYGRNSMILQELRVRGYIGKPMFGRDLRLGKAGVTHTGRRTERGGTARGTLLLFSLPSPPHHHRDTTPLRHTPTPHGSSNGRNVPNRTPRRRQQKAPCIPGPPLLHRQYRPDPRAGTSIPSDSSLRHVPDPAYGLFPPFRSGGLEQSHPTASGTRKPAIANTAPNDCGGPSGPPHTYRYRKITSG